MQRLYFTISPEKINMKSVQFLDDIFQDIVLVGIILVLTDTGMN